MNLKKKVINKKEEKKEKAFTLYVIVLIVSFAIGFFFKFFDNSPIDNFQTYLQIFTTVTGIILGLILVIIIFYLGKKHDYKKDFINKFAELKETLDKYRINRKKLKNKQKKLQSY